MKNNNSSLNYLDEPLSGNRTRRQRDAILGAAANLVTREAFADIGFADLLLRLSFDRLAANGLASPHELASFYRSPDMLLNALFDTMLVHLDARISRVAANDPESLGRFERAYRIVISGRANLEPLIVSGLDGALVSRLFFLFMSVMDHESRHGTSFTLQQRWMGWYNRQIARYDEEEGVGAVAAAATVA
ncbi:hypothetical protein NB640_11650 [Oxalobacter vibrioformis]|uniref:Uncharacterized protein n=1 Tax=Oxalobacter vibrioformis TaxID=933080 RepID=A0A9E9LZ10_9BURK|nr:hypothetical protein [Oxalobacter vibrioformis]WAW09858.1 hypothetical protein NB640_11650 [Oxalobacter vibrioformis]